MEDLMNEIDLGDDELLDDYDQEVQNSQMEKKKQEQAKDQEDNNFSDSLEEKPKKQLNKSKKDQFSSKRVQFYNGKIIRKPQLEEEDIVADKESSKHSVGNILDEVEKSENQQDEDNEENKEEENEEKQSQQNEEDVRDKKISQNDTCDIGEEKKQLWQQEILLGQHRAYLDDNQNFDSNKFIQDVDEETREKCKEKVKGDIKKLEDRTNRKIELIKGGGTHKRSQVLKEKSEKLEKINNKFQKSLNQIKETLGQSKKESAIIERRPSEQKLIEKKATQVLKETQKNTLSSKKLKIDNATVNEIKKHEFNFSQKEKVNDEEPHPWL